MLGSVKATEHFDFDLLRINTPNDCDGRGGVHDAAHDCGGRYGGGHGDGHGDGRHHGDDLKMYQLSGFADAD